MMKNLSQIIKTLVNATMLTTVIAFSGAANSHTIEKLIDDFNHKTNNSLGLPRQFINDTTAGGKTTTTLTISNGSMHQSGDIIPPRGQPGWASSVLLLDAQGMPINLSQYEGIKLLIKVRKGNLSVSANSTEVTNFDYHAAPVIISADEQFHEVKLPFNAMKRAWSEQTPLNTKTINSVSIVAYAMQRSSFDYHIREVSFY
ncbi:CIA30 family protein [Thalassotalea sp. PP2-459]|uniref:CIA30 family protein n=1 Tax=Thalassotalea sp. PP2-459 TaxID=1742724 RepID=UPI001C37E02A|nr:CIA30 family protein [Thalassotalea sp. PP2-459]